MSAPRTTSDSGASAQTPHDQPAARDDAGSRSFRLSSKRISYAADDGRRKSIQFNVAGSEAQLLRRSGSVKRQPRATTPQGQEKEKRPAKRVPSPPPPSSYQRGVSFDTFDNRDATDFSLTLNYKHKGYQSTRRSRTFLCGTDQNEHSDFALEWLIDELVDDGDEIVCLRVVEKDSKIASESSIEEGKYRQEAEKLFEQVIQKNSQDEKAISLVMELAVGKVQEIIQRMIQIYEPAVLIVGTRGRSFGMQGLLPGSVSKYCLQQSPIPVIVVRPSAKREKKKKKRLADPNRHSYNDILKMSEKRGSRLFDTSTDSLTKLQEEEAAAVAKAIGLPADYADRGYSPGDSRETLSSKNSEPEDGRSTPDAQTLNPDSPNAVVLKSPMLGDYDSPSVTETESDGDAEAVAQSGVTAVGGDDGSKTPTDTGSAVSSTEAEEGVLSEVIVTAPNDDEVSPTRVPVEEDTMASPNALQSVPPDVAVVDEEDEETSPKTGSLENGSMPSKEADAEPLSAHEQTPTISSAIPKDNAKNA
ncbi:hypothetical protein VTN02DRAFT_1698 [Thermoascus thermophilus]